MRPIGVPRGGAVINRDSYQPAIPDSAINQYLYADFSTSEWTDSIGSLDLTTISGPTADGTAFGGNGGVSGDGTDDYAQGGQFTFLDSNYYSQWAVAFGFSTTDDAALWSGIVGGTSTDFSDLWQSGVGLDADAGRLGISRRFNGNSVTRIQSNTTVNDGGNYVAIIQSTGPTASDIEMYFEPATDAAVVKNAGTDGTGSESFTSPGMTYYARADGGGSISNNIAIDLTDIRWFNSSLNQSERSNVFDEYSWYDPSTDAP